MTQEIRLETIDQRRESSIGKVCRACLIAGNGSVFWNGLGWEILEEMRRDKFKKLYIIWRIIGSFERSF